MRYRLRFRHLRDRMRYGLRWCFCVGRRRRLIAAYSSPIPLSCSLGLKVIGLVQDPARVARYKILKSDSWEKLQETQNGVNDDGKSARTMPDLFVAFHVRRRSRHSALWRTGWSRNRIGHNDGQ